MNIILTEKVKKHLLESSIEELIIDNNSSGMCWSASVIPSVRSGKNQIDFLAINVDGIKIYINPVFKKTIYEIVIDVRRLLFRKEIYIREYKMN